MSERKKHESDEPVKSLEEIEKQISEFKKGILQFFETTQKPLVLNLRLYEPHRNIPRVEEEATMMFMEYQIICLGNIVKRKEEIRTKEGQNHSSDVIERFLEIVSTVLEDKKKHLTIEEKLSKYGRYPATKHRAERIKNLHLETE
jgi:hypothetical protein